MKRWLLVPVVIVVILLGLMLASGLVIKTLVSGPTLVAKLQAALGVPVSVSGADFDLGQWFLLKPAISLDNVSLGNPPGFRTKWLLTARELSAQVLLIPLLSKEVRVRSIAVRQPRILVEKNAQGATNVEAFVKSLSSGGGSGGASLAVERLTVTAGEVSFPRQRMRIHDIGIDLRDFQADSTCGVELSARLFEGTISRVRLKGNAGPFRADSLPLGGKLSVTLAPAEMPAAFRDEMFGKFFGAPGASARAALEATVKGNLYGTLAGPSKLTLEDVLIGKDAQHVLPLSGEAPVSFSASRLMSEPALQLKITGARLKLSKGEWKGDAALAMRGSSVSASSRGSIRNVEINELIGSLTSAEGKIFGVTDVPEYSLELAGRSADEMMDALKGGGKLSVKQGRIAALDMLASIQNALQSGQGTAEAKGVTPFTALEADVAIGQKRIEASNLVLDGAGLRATGGGTIGFDHTLNFNLEARVSGGVAQFINRVARSGGGSEATVPLTISGMVESPKVRPNVGKMATGVVKGLVEGLFQKKK